MIDLTISVEIVSP